MPAIPLCKGKRERESAKSYARQELEQELGQEQGRDSSRAVFIVVAPSY